MAIIFFTHPKLHMKKNQPFWIFEKIGKTNRFFNCFSASRPPRRLIFYEKKKTTYPVIQMARVTGWSSWVTGGGLCYHSPSPTLLLPPATTPPSKKKKIFICIMLLPSTTLPLPPGYSCPLYIIGCITLSPNLLCPGWKLCSKSRLD